MHWARSQPDDILEAAAGCATECGDASSNESTEKALLCVAICEFSDAFVIRDRHTHKNIATVVRCATDDIGQQEERQLAIDALRSHFMQTGIDARMEAATRALRVERFTQNAPGKD